MKRYYVAYTSPEGKAVVKFVPTKAAGLKLVRELQAEGIMSAVFPFFGQSGY